MFFSDEYDERRRTSNLERRRRRDDDFWSDVVSSTSSGLFEDWLNGELDCECDSPDGDVGFGDFFGDFFQ